MAEKEQQDERWQALTEDGRQARIASYQELLKLQKEEADSYLITIEDLEKLYGKHNLQPQPLTYEDVARELFKGKDVAFIDSDGDIDGFRCTLSNTASKPNVCSSLKQAEKLLAINRLLNVAKFLNKDWKPDWKRPEQDKWYIYIDENNEIRVNVVSSWCSGDVYFRTEDLAKQTIQILGEDTVRLALRSDY